VEKEMVVLIYFQFVPFLVNVFEGNAISNSNDLPVNQSIYFFRKNNIFDYP
jgi:hypothetical protein